MIRCPPSTDVRIGGIDPLISGADLGILRGGGGGSEPEFFKGGGGVLGSRSAELFIY